MTQALWTAHWLIEHGRLIVELRLGGALQQTYVPKTVADVTREAAEAYFRELSPLDGVLIRHTGDEAPD